MPFTFRPEQISVAFLEEALREGAAHPRWLEVWEACRNLAQSAWSGDSSSFARYQGLLLFLYKDSNARTEPARRWLAHQLSSLEDARIESFPGFTPVSQGAFRDWVHAQINARTRERHPMSVHLFQGQPTQSEIRFFLRHHWVRSHDFYQLMAEQADRFTEISDEAVFFRNLYDEMGSEKPEKAHPLLLSHLLRHMELPLEIPFASLDPEEMAYLNHRIRCVRHPDVAWGLAMLYAVETVSASSHRQIHEMLRRAGVAEEYCEFHRLHSNVDAFHSEDLWRLIEARAGDAEFQKTFARAMHRHFQVNERYFHRLWDLMRREPKC